MVKQSKFIVRVRGNIAVYDVPVQTSGNSFDAAKIVHDELAASEKVIAVYQNMGDEDHFAALLK